MPTTHDPLYLTTDQAAQRYGLPRSWFLRHGKDGLIPSIRVGKYRLFPLTALDAWFAAHPPRRPDPIPPTPIHLSRLQTH